MPASRPDVHLVTFDLNDNVLTGVKNGTIDLRDRPAAVLARVHPVLLLTQYVRYKLVMANNFLPGRTSSTHPTSML